MIDRYVTTLTVGLLLGAMATAPGATWAQDPAKDLPTARTTTTLKVDPALPPIEVPPEILEHLNGMAKESNEAMAAVNALLAQDLEKIQNADAIFDTMIKTIRDAAANGAPESAFVKKIEELAKQARTDAATAKELQDEKLATHFLAYAAAFEESKGEAISYYTSSFRNIRDIEREKRRFVLAMKAKQYALAKQNVEQGLKVLQELDGRIRRVRGALPDVPVEA